MKKLLTFALRSILVGTLFLGSRAALAERLSEEEDVPAVRKGLHDAVQKGNFNDAYVGLRKLLLDSAVVPSREDLTAVVQCLQRLNRIAEIDELLESALKAHQDRAGRWWFLWDVAGQYRAIPHEGFIVAGKFTRGPHRGGTGRPVNANARDRVRALQLMVQTLPAALKDRDHRKAGDYMFALAEVWRLSRGYGPKAWRWLAAKTDLAVLPDYEDGWGDDYMGPAHGAPVDENGRPVFYSAPKTFEAAANDGQRWRWCLEQAIELDPARTSEVRYLFADFLRQEFDVQTLADYGWRFGRAESDDSQDQQAGIFALSTLGEDETITRLATGVRRFKLPDEFNCIKVYQRLAAEREDPYAPGALGALARIFENRRQYPKAAGYWRRLLAEYPRDFHNAGQWRDSLNQIEGNWGRFEPVMGQPAGQGATVEYRFRNGSSIALTAHEITVQKLLDDVKAYIKTRPQRMDWEKTNVGDIGYRLVTRNQLQYLGKEVASWRMEVKPRPRHFDKRVTIATPLQKAGAYLLKATMEGGNTSYIVLWLQDTAIVKKPMEGKTYYFVADARSGAPVPKANLEFFGWKHDWRGPGDIEVLLKDFAELADADGQVLTEPAAQPGDYQWLITATTPAGRLAYLGFTGAWYGQRYDPEYNETKVYAISDRPVYRPEHVVKYKFWVAHAQYDAPEDRSAFAGQAFTVEIHNPKGEKVLSEAKKADAYGGLEGEYKLPADATLGVYGMNVLQGVKTLGGASFRVEEYKKPEFEVTVDAPADPVMLGEKIAAKVTAKYYFGSPVTKAKVKYKVERTGADERWYPPAPWDWLFGEGYWWYACDEAWYPGWSRWGCWRPMPMWWPQPQLPPELVAERELEIGPDGTVKVEIDTAVAQALHGDEDHRYTITAEVVDASRRTIVGTGSVLVARRPFKVYTWVDRGYYRIGDTISAGMAARRLDGKPVEGKGDLSLLRITYKKGEPVETPVQTWKLDTDQEGQARRQLTASQAGQYRLSYKLTDAKGHAIEGGYLLTVIGEGFDSAQFRFNHLELVPDKAEYAPGEKVKLQINTDRAGGTVLLFARPTNGVYQKPRVLRLDGKSTVEEIEVVKRDMPNMFVEAVTVTEGRVHTETRQIAVPPEKRVLGVEVLPSAAEYKPGQKAKVKVKLTDYFGKPFVGSTAVAVYDKSVEYISGGSNVPEIKEFFWKWQRHHFPQTESNLGRFFQNLIPPNTPGMSDLGIFGHSAADQEDPGANGGPGGGGGRSGGLGGARHGGYGFLQDGAPGNSLPEAKPEAKGEAAAPADAPAAAAAPGRQAMAALPYLAAGQTGKGPGPAAPLVQPTLRTKFADTALWLAALATDNDGTAEVALDMPENLTIWRIKVWAMGHGTQVGQGQTDVVTRKDLIVRLEAPRFFVQNDEVVLSAVVHNYLKTKKEVAVALELADNGVFAGTVAAAGKNWEMDKAKIAEPGKPAGGAFLTNSQTVAIAPQGEARVDWRVKVLDEGEAVVRMKALTDEESDALEMRFPCYVHGMLKMEVRSGVIRAASPLPPGEGPGVRAGAKPGLEAKADATKVSPLPPGEAPAGGSPGVRAASEGRMTFTVPDQRRPKQTRVEVRYSPTLAGAMVDALPYLVDYPYGCTEQTLNRFLPTVITQKILLDMKLNLADIRQKQTNLNAQEIGDDKGRAKQWKRYDRNPVFDEDEVRRMVKDGVQRLTEMQLGDGGWGWFSGWGEQSTPHTTALVVHGLQLARQNDVAVVPGMIERGVQWLARYQDEQVQWLKNAAIKDKPPGLRWKEHADELDAFVYMVLVDAGVKHADMREFLDRDRTKLAVYALAMYGLALDKEGQKEKLAVVLQNIGQYVQQDDENQTAWLNLPDGCWWYWYGSEYEAHAYYLKLLSRTDPKGELASRLVKYLLNNRKHASYWNSTRDTAVCVEAMAEYLRRSGEARPEMTIEVFWDGKLQRAVEITPQTLFTFQNKFVLEGEAVTAGPHEVKLVKKGAGPLYYNGYLTNFTLEDPIAKAGLEIKVERRYYKLVKADKTRQAAGSRGQVVEEKVEKYRREPLENLAMLTSGDLVEIELEIDSKNDYEYLVFEDMKPCGFEPVEQRSGYTPNDLGAYVEYRDNRVVFFARTLARGRHSVAYRMRAETPGRMSALPTRAWAMYAPELRANSDEIKLRVKD
ncbi:MAG: MG2 domain-containing protein [Thermoguttaceae bacterium]